MSDVATKSRELVTTDLKSPSRYKVILLNDDVTPVEFVVNLMMKVFRHSEESAVYLTLKVHNEGSAVAGIYNFEIAEQKTIDATTLARENGYPLIIKMEEE